jgi:hypothetical protein
MQAVVDPSGPIVVGFVPENAILVSDFQNFVKVDYPHEMDQETLGVESDGQGGFTFVQDPAKLQAKLDASWTALRTERNLRLANSDWTQMNDSPLSQDAKASWSDYRQALRDLPESVTDPLSVVWPQAPV